MNAIKATRTSISDVLVIPMSQEDVAESLKVASKLREEKINTDIFFEDAKMKKKMKYADKWNIPFVVIIGEEERKSSLYTLKDMESGEQRKLTIDELVKFIKL